VAVKIRLKRMGKIRVPHYRIVVADSRTKRDGRVIEEIGKYHPKDDPSLIEVDSERAQYWLGVGAQPSEPVLALLKLTGDWQRFNGDAGAESTVRVSETRAQKSDIFNEALKDAHGEPKTEAVTRRRKPGTQPAAGTVVEPGTGDTAPADTPSAATQSPESAGTEPVPAPAADATAENQPAGADDEPAAAGTAAAAGDTADAIDSVAAVEVSPADAAESGLTAADPTGSAGSGDAGASTPE
jgi:small subunit ribosomal protein S16